MKRWLLIAALLMSTLAYGEAQVMVYGAPGVPVFKSVDPWAVCQVGGDHLFLDLAQAVIIDSVNEDTWLLSNPPTCPGPCVAECDYHTVPYPPEGPLSGNFGIWGSPYEIAT